MANKINVPITTQKWFSQMFNIPGWLDLSSGCICISLCLLQSYLGFRGNITEIGVYHGKFLSGLATTLIDNEFAIAVDIFEDQYLNTDLKGYEELGSYEIYELNENIFLNNFKNFANLENIKVLRKSSTTVTPDEILFGYKSRFISIDGGHSYDVFLHDLKLSEVSLEDFGIIAIDDILNPQWPGIVTATIRHIDSSTRLRPLAFIENKLLCCFEDKLNIFKDFLRSNFHSQILRTDVEFSHYRCDLYTNIGFEEKYLNICEFVA